MAEIHEPASAQVHDESVPGEGDFVDKVLNTAPCLIVVLDRKGRIVRFNQVCCDLTGYTFDEVRGRAVWDMLLPAGQVDAVRGVFRSLVVEDPAASDMHSYPHTYENDWVTKDGRRRTILWSNDSVHDEHGELVAIVGAGLDITERKRIEEALRESEERYRSLVDHASVCIKELDRDGRIVTMNRAGMQILEVDDVALVEGRCFLDCVPAADRARIEDLLARAYEGASPEFEFTMHCAGQAKILSSTLIPVRARDGTVDKVVAVTQDITDRRRAQQKLVEQESLVRLGQMVAVIAHEVRNPLAGIRGAIQALGSLLPPDGRGHAVLPDILARLDALNAMMQDMLTFARPAAPTVTPMAVQSLIEQTLDVARHDPVFAAIEVAVDGDAGIVEADSQQLSRVVLNVLLNAAQAMEGRGRIEVCARREGDRCELAIKDTGPGIPPDIRARIFDPFFTTKRRGTGLGLATARQVVERHGGAISVDCPPGGGTTVTLQIPSRQ